MRLSYLAEGRTRSARVGGLGVCFASVALLLAAGGCSRGAGGGASPPSIARASTLTAIQDRGVLRVGMEPTFRPFEYKEENGEVVGFDVDLMRELATALGVKLEITQSRFDGLFGSLVNGNVDMVCSGVTATLPRARQYAFSQPYFVTGLCLLVARDSEVQSYRDLNRSDITLALKKATTGFLVASKRFPKAKQKLLDEEAACALEVVQGRADAFVYDKFSVLIHHERYPKKTRAILEPFTYEPYAIMFRQGEGDLGRFLDQFVATVRRDGRLATLRKKYFGDAKER